MLYAPSADERQLWVNTFTWIIFRNEYLDISAEGDIGSPKSKDGRIRRPKTPTQDITHDSIDEEASDRQSAPAQRSKSPKNKHNMKPPRS